MVNKREMVLCLGFGTLESYSIMNQMLNKYTDKEIQLKSGTCATKKKNKEKIEGCNFELGG